MKNKTYVTAKEAEQEMQVVRQADGFTGKMETDYISRMIKDAKRNSVVGDKLQLVVDPTYIHIPEWQRRITKAKSFAIGNCYNKYKWDAPKVLVYKNRLLVIDGQHRIYGAFKASMDAVVVEIMECTLEEAIDLFLDQTKDRTRMLPRDIYRAAIVGKKPDYLMLRDICKANNVAVLGDDGANTVGILTSISDGISLVRSNPELLDSILRIIGKLGWNGYAESYCGKAYTARVLRVFRKMYAYFAGRENQMEAALLKHCKGTEYFANHLIDKTQAQMFDKLCDIVEYEMQSPFTQARGVKRA